MITLALCVAATGLWWLPHDFYVWWTASGFQVFVSWISHFNSKMIGERKIIHEFRNIYNQQSLNQISFKFVNHRLAFSCQHTAFSVTTQHPKYTANYGYSNWNVIFVLSTIHYSWFLECGLEHVKRKTNLTNVIKLEKSLTSGFAVSALKYLFNW